MAEGTEIHAQPAEHAILRDLSQFAWNGSENRSESTYLATSPVLTQAHTDTDVKTG
jgi:hypothetical protein